MKNDYPTKDGTTTRKGKVVYKRKKKLWQVHQVGNIAVSIIHNYDPEYLKTQVLGINYLYEVVRGGLYPYYLDVKEPQRREGDPLWRAIEAEIRELWKEGTFEVCRRVGTALKVPEWIQDLVIDVLGEFIWNTIWKMTDIIFGKDAYGSKEAIKRQVF